MIRPHYHRWSRHVKTALLGSLLSCALPLGAQSVDCTYEGAFLCTVTHQMSAGVSMDRSDGNPDCIRGTTGNDTLRMDVFDSACMLGGNDTVTVERNTLSYAVIDLGNGTDKAICLGGCDVTKVGSTGSGRVDCDGWLAALYGAGGMDEMHVFNECEVAEFFAGSNDDDLIIHDCTALLDIEYNGNGGNDLIDRNGTPGCSTSDYTETLTSVETIIP